MGPLFCGNPINMDRPATSAPARGQGFDSFDGRTSGYPESSRRGPLFDQRTPMMTRTPTRAHPYTKEVIIGVKIFQDYMTEFQYLEVNTRISAKFIPKFDSSKNNSFVHWYKHLVSTTLATMPSTASCVCITLFSTPCTLRPTRSPVRKGMRLSVVILGASKTSLLASA